MIEHSGDIPETRDNIPSTQSRCTAGLSPVTVYTPSIRVETSCASIVMICMIRFGGPVYRDIQQHFQCANDNKRNNSA